MVKSCTFVLQVVNYVVEKMVLDKGLDGVGSDGRSSGPTGGQSQLVTVGDGSWSVLKPWQKLKPLIEILCNNQASGYILVTI